VSTDDPKMFGTNLSQELSGLHEELGFSAGEIRTLILQAARDSWLPPDRKQRLVDTLEGDPSWVDGVSSRRPT
jgi:adenosine deaminase